LANKITTMKLHCWVKQSVKQYILLCVNFSV